MKTHSAIFPVLALCLAASPLRADEKPLREILRDGLYAEEVERDPAAAAKSYEELLSRYGEERVFAASALFRLAEVRRKQDRKEDAIRLYQRLLVEFPQAENEATLARENLVAMGGELPVAEMAETDPESKELARLQALAKTSPDVLRDPTTLLNAIHAGFPKAVAYLLAAGADPFSEGNLRAAARDGNLTIVKQLLGTGRPVPEAEGQKAVKGAAQSDRIAVLEFLLESGIRLDSTNLYELLFEGVSAEAKQLLKHGADPNALILHGGPPQPMLNALISQGRFEAADWLLDLGAKPDVPDELTGLTPLHYAAKAKKPGCVELMERLLEAGAEANRVTASATAENKNFDFQAGATPMDEAVRSDYEVSAKSRVLLAHGANPNLSGTELSPLATSVALGNFELAKLFIEAGADLKKPGLLSRFLYTNRKDNVEKLRFLLDSGADPNIPNGVVMQDQTEDTSDPFLKVTGKVEEYPYLPINRLHFPWRRGEGDEQKVEIATSLELARLMLDAGAKAGPLVGDMLHSVARIDETGDVFRNLLAQGEGKVSVHAFKDMEQWKPAPREIYLNDALIPALAELPDITLLERETGKRTTLAKGGEGAKLPSTLELLREKSREILAGQWTDLALLRVDEDGSVTRLPFDLSGDAPLPELRAGDVVEMGRGDTGDEGKASYFWNLDKRISFPITLEIDGKKREILLRGDLLSFDPTKDEVPLVDAGMLAALFLPDDVRWESMLIKRAGWNDIRFSFGAGGGEDFQLQAGDRLVIDRVVTSSAEEVVGSVRLVSPGLPFGEKLGVVSNDGVFLPPTLVQLITSAYAPPEYWLLAPLENDGFFGWLYEKERFSREVPVVLPHPDFSAIRIRRKGAGREELLIEVDLTESIKAFAEGMSADEAKASDVTLQGGDVVELPWIEARAGEPWGGFSPEEAEFFHTVLAGNVLLNLGGGKVEQREINYQPAQWRRTPHGLLPRNPDEGTTNTQLRSEVDWENARILREGIGIFDANPRTFLRDGDQIDYQFGGRVRGPRVVIPLPSR